MGLLTGPARQSGHPDAEWRNILDRVYQDESGTFVIVDYKTGMAAELKKSWITQLERYAQALSEATGSNKIENRVLSVTKDELQFHRASIRNPE